MLLSSPCGPSTHHCVVVTCTGQVVCHRETSSQQPQLQTQLTASGPVPCPLLSPLLCLSLKNDQKSKSAPQSASLLSAEHYVGRRKEGEKKKMRKMEKKVVNVTEP